MFTLNHVGIVTRALLGFLVAACTSLPGGARIDPTTVQAGQPAFHGLLASAGEASPQSTRYVFVVHGMGDTARSYAAPLYARIRAEGYQDETSQDWADARLSVPMTVRGEATDCANSDDPPCRFTSFGQFRVDTFRDNSSARRVVVYTFYWHSDLHRIQAPFLSADLEERRAVVTRALKRDIIVMGFGDAAAYLGESGQLVRAGLSTGLCAMLHDAAGSPVAVVAGGVDCSMEDLTAQDAQAFAGVDFGFLTMSLGSRMLYDTLDEHARRSDPVLPALARRTRYFFMLANQLPLLGLGRVTVAQDAGDATADTGVNFDLPGDSGCSRTAGFFNLAACERESGGGATSDVLGVPPIAQALDVVAFHDPEDFLGFSAGKGMASAPTGVRFVEVWNRNAAVYLGLFANPMRTHAVELDHDKAAQLILCGASADADGRLRPRECL